MRARFARSRFRAPALSPKPYAGSLPSHDPKPTFLRTLNPKYLLDVQRCKINNQCKSKLMKLAKTFSKNQLLTSILQSKTMKFADDESKAKALRLLKHLCLIGKLCFDRAHEGGHLSKDARKLQAHDDDKLDRALDRAMQSYPCCSC